MERHQFRHNGLSLSYLDSGGDGHALIALHAHWMEGLTYASLAEALAPEWRVIALDQRGHGHSDHAPTYTRADYLNDLRGLYGQLDLASAVLLGNSLGGVNAYQFAARHPASVRALIIEDIGTEIAADTSFALEWSGVFPTLEGLERRVGARFAPYLRDSFRSVPEGWRLAFDPRDTEQSQSFLNGDHWSDWNATSCPALVIRGRDSRVTTQEQMDRMAERRPNTYVRTMDGGHVVHLDDPVEFTQAVREFLASLGPEE